MSASPSVQELEASRQRARRSLIAALGASALIAICCFTPALVVAVTAISLGALTGYLDYILFPGLAISLALAYLAYRRYQTACQHCQAAGGIHGS